MALSVDDKTLYIYIYLFKHVSLNSKDTFCLYNLIKILSSFLISILVLGSNWGMNLPDDGL